VKAAVFSWVLAALFILGLQTAFAAETRVFDMADLFTDSEEASLEETIDSLRSTMNMDAAVVTTEENPMSAQDFADYFYEEKELGVGDDHDGVLLLIDMENGELWISTEGKMIRYLTDKRIETILDNGFEYAVDGDFYGCAKSFLADVETCFHNGIASDQYNYDSETGEISRYHSIQWYEILFALAVAGFCGGMAVFGVVREYNMKDNSNNLAANFKLSYRKDSSFLLGAILADVLIGSYITQQRIASQNNSGGHSGGHSLSSGGRSTTHRSSSGRVHGGGGRKFR